MPTKILHCVEGHDFEYTKDDARGRWPVRCPAHHRENKRKLDNARAARKRQFVTQPPSIREDLLRLDKLADAIIPNRQAFRQAIQKVKATGTEGAYMELAAVALAAARLLQPVKKVKEVGHDQQPASNTE